MPLEHRLVIGSLHWEDKKRLTDTGLKIIYTNLVAAVLGNIKMPYKSEDIDATLFIEGEHDHRKRMLGTLHIGQTSILALQHGITERQKTPMETKRTPGKLSIALGIGSPLFGVANMTFWAMGIPDELKANAQAIIREFDTFKDGEFAWLDSADPEHLHRDDMHRLNQVLLQRF